MVISTFIRRSLLGLLLLVLIYPYMFAFSKVESSFILSPELVQAMLNTILQSSVSAVALLFFGFLGAFGLLAIRSKKFFAYTKAACLLPSFLPILFYILAVLEVIKPFPYGLVGIILIHILTAVGLASLVLYGLIVTEWKSLASLAYIEGASPFQFLKKMIFSSRSQVFLVFLFFFSYFFVSFATPLLVGHQTMTVETYIYENLRTTGSFSQPVFASFLEMFILIAVLWFYKPLSASVSQNNFSEENIFLLSFKSLQFILWIPTLIYTLGSLRALVAAGANKNLFFHPDFFNLFFQSLKLSLDVGFVLVLFFIAILINYDQNKILKWLLGYIPLSTILFAMSFAGNQTHAGIKATLALSILFFPALYRYQFKEKLDGLAHQCKIAWLMGANVFLIFKKILFPQTKETIFFLAGLGAFWSIGDFAMSRVIFGQEKTLAIFIQNLANQYRLDEAIFYEMILLLIGLVVFWCISELKHVFN